MMKTTTAFLAAPALVALVAAPAALAAGEMKTGLWEMSVLLSPEQLASMPKDMKMPGLVGNRMSRQVCITPREAESLGMLDDDAGACKLSNKGGSGLTHTADVVCNSPNKQGMGKWTTVFRDSGNMSSVVEFTVPLADKTVTQRHETFGRWIQADCGAVK
jgi:hypothetical protein